MTIQSGYPSVATLTGVQVPTWANPNNALGGPNGVYSNGQAGPTGVTKTLELTGFGLAVPTGSTVKGFRVTSTQKVGSGGGGDQITEAMKFATVIANTPKTYSDGSIVSHAKVLGDVNDLWGASGVTAEDVNAAGFGVSFSLTDTSGDAGVALDLDSVFLEVIYSPPGSTVIGTTPTGGTSTVAYGTNEMFSSTSIPGKLRVEPSKIQPKTFAAGSGTLAPLTPVAYNTSTNFWVPFASGGANGTGTIKGFVGLDPIVLDAANETLGNVIMAGNIHFADIPIIAGYTSNQLKTALTGTVRSLGFEIQGLEKWY